MFLQKRQESEEGDEEEVSVGEESAEEEEYKSEGEDDDEDEGSEEEEEDDEAPAARRPVTRRSGRGQETTPARELPDEDEGGVLTGVRRKAYDDVSLEYIHALDVFTCDCNDMLVVLKVTCRSCSTSRRLSRCELN